MHALFVNEGDTKVYVCISVSYAAACHNHIVFETWVGEKTKKRIHPNEHKTHNNKTPTHKTPNKVCAGQV